MPGAWFTKGAQLAALYFLDCFCSQMEKFAPTLSCLIKTRVYYSQGNFWT